MDNCTVNLNPDIVGVGVRVSLEVSSLLGPLVSIFYISDDFLDSLEFTLGVNGCALLITTFVKTLSHEIDLFHTICVFFMICLAGVSLQHRHRKSKSKVRKYLLFCISTVATFSFVALMFYTFYKAPSFGAKPQCNSKIVIELFGLDAPATNLMVIIIHLVVLGVTAFVMLLVTIFLLRFPNRDPIGPEKPPESPEKIQVNSQEQTQGSSLGLGQGYSSQEQTQGSSLGLGQRESSQEQTQGSSLGLGQRDSSLEQIQDSFEEHNASEKQLHYFEPSIIDERRFSLRLFGELGSRVYLIVMLELMLQKNDVDTSNMGWSFAQILAILTLIGPLLELFTLIKRPPEDALSKMLERVKSVLAAPERYPLVVLVVFSFAELAISPLAGAVAFGISSLISKKHIPIEIGAIGGTMASGINSFIILTGSTTGDEIIDWTPYITSGIAVAPIVTLGLAKWQSVPETGVETLLEAAGAVTPCLIAKNILVSLCEAQYFHPLSLLLGIPLYGLAGLGIAKRSDDENYHLCNPGIAFLAGALYGLFICAVSILKAFSLRYWGSKIIRESEKQQKDAKLKTAGIIEAKAEMQQEQARLRELRASCVQEIFPESPGIRKAISIGDEVEAQAKKEESQISSRLANIIRDEATLVVKREEGLQEKFDCMKQLQASLEQEKNALIMEGLQTATEVYPAEQDEILSEAIKRIGDLSRRLDDWIKAARNLPLGQAAMEQKYLDVVDEKETVERETASSKISVYRQQIAILERYSEKLQTDLCEQRGKRNGIREKIKAQQELLRSLKDQKQVLEMELQSFQPATIPSYSEQDMMLIQRTNLEKHAERLAALISELKDTNERLQTIHSNGANGNREYLEGKIAEWQAEQQRVQYQLRTSEDESLAVENRSKLLRETERLSRRIVSKEGFIKLLQEEEESLIQKIRQRSGELKWNGSTRRMLSGQANYLAKEVEVIEDQPDQELMRSARDEETTASRDISIQLWGRTSNFRKNSVQLMNDLGGFIRGSSAAQQPSDCENLRN
ncbi:hypothetical protein CNMCM5623_006235 [Aspergillus felis]|uniref:Uncharacterized protein n=1 Tax=Aspergillus felis TaxID=1287682 RepID=A0A8H6QJR3_9EURO|nr:hypothetical protein CNMCM5623_006235 [Aspergillus felis]